MIEDLFIFDTVSGQISVSLVQIFSAEIVFQTVVLQFTAVLTLHAAATVFSPKVVPYFLYSFSYTSDLCHKCTRTGSQSGCLGTETFSVITKALPNGVILLSFKFCGLSIDYEQIFFLVYTPRLTVIKIFLITAVLSEKHFCHIIVFPSKLFFSYSVANETKCCGAGVNAFVTA